MKPNKKNITQDTQRKLHISVEKYLKEDLTNMVIKHFVIWHCKVN